MELDREQIRKALENCENECCDACENCPSPPNTSGGCVVFVMRQALALINSQEQRIKELTEENERLKESNKQIVTDAVRSVSRLNAENEMLRDELAKAYKELDESVNFYCSFTKSKIQNCPIDDEVAKAKADTVRKMQERLHERFHDRVAYTRSYVHDTIDQIEKEMLEDHNNET